MVKWPEGRREALLFVLEEEIDPRRFSIRRLAHYCLDLSELLATDRAVPVVIFLRGHCLRAFSRQRQPGRPAQSAEHALCTGT